MAQEKASIPANVSDRLLLRHRATILLVAALNAADAADTRQIFAELLECGRDLLAVIPRFLETSDPHALTRIGALLKAYPDRPAVIQLLRRVALQTSNSDLRRMASLFILEQFFEQALGQDFYALLHDPVGMVRQILERLLASVLHDRNMLLAFLLALEEQNPTGPRAVLSGMNFSPTNQVIDVLRFYIQHENLSVAQRAMTALSTFDGDEALLALRSLTLVLPPGQSAKAQRRLRKIELSGQRLPDFDAIPPGARALQTPIDGHGSLAIWFMIPRAASGVVLFSVILNDEKGIIDAFGGENLTSHSLPAPGPLGSVYHQVAPALDLELLPQAVTPEASGDFSFVALVADGSGDDPAANRLLESDQSLDFVEAPFDYARAQVLAYQKLNWASQQPLPPEYQMLHDIIWRYGPPQAAPLDLPQPASPVRTLDFPRLFVGSCFRNWYLQGPAVNAAARQLLERHGSATLAEIPSAGLLDAGATARGVAGKAVLQTAAAIADEYFTPENVAKLASRLVHSAEWLTLSGDETAASLALLASRQLRAAPSSRNYFAILLAQRGLTREMLILGRAASVNAR